MIDLVEILSVVQQLLGNNRVRIVVLGEPVILLQKFVFAKDPIKEQLKLLYMVYPLYYPLKMIFFLSFDSISLKGLVVHLSLKDSLIR